MKNLLTFLLAAIATFNAFGQTAPTYRIVQTAPLNYAVLLDIVGDPSYTNITFEGNIPIFFTDSCTLSYTSVTGSWNAAANLNSATVTGQCSQNSSTRYAFKQFVSNVFTLGNRTSNSTDTLFKIVASTAVKTGRIVIHSGTTTLNQNGTLEECWNINYPAYSPPTGKVNTGIWPWMAVKYNMTSSGVGYLPVTLTAFDAMELGEDVLLHWSTAAEKNNSGFEVERSFDGIKWETIEFIQSNSTDGNSVDQLNYTYVDRNAALSSYKAVYYRLNQIDFNSKNERSGIRVVIPSKATNFSLGHVRPNPIKIGESITFYSNKTRVSDLKIRLTDSQGQLIHEYVIMPGVLRKELRISNYLTPGIYYIQCSDGQANQAFPVALID